VGGPTGRREAVTAMNGCPRRRWFLIAAAAAVAGAGALAAPNPDAVVALDGSGQFTSLQEAISAAPLRTDPAAPRWVIRVKPGTYRERIYVQRERGHLLIQGEDAATTLITFNLDATLRGPDEKPIGTFRTPTVQIDGDGMIWENVTIANAAGPVGQAIALRTDGDRLVFRHCAFLGWQDTMLLNRGRVYFEDCRIEGDVDFIFGGATAYFDRCRLHCRRDGYVTAASTPKGQRHGFVFADGTLTAAAGVKTYLGRPWRDFAQTVFLRTALSAAVRPEGWHNWDKSGAERTAVYAEFASTGPGANPAARVAWSRQLDADQAAPFTPSGVLAGDDGWNPTGRLRLVLVGDSTVADRTGWGRGLRQFLTAAVECTNVAAGGRSSKSFRDEGRWAQALALRGDYYLIQFGHNDQPGKGPARETDPNTSFAANLARYVDDVRAIGAEPILVTALTRRDFRPDGSGRLADTLGPYVEAARKVAAEKHVPLIDLHARSTELCERLGPQKCAALNPRKADGTPDTTHLDAGGSVLFARLVAEDLRRLVPRLAPDLRSDPNP
jgi:pectinesterase